MSLVTCLVATYLCNCIVGWAPLETSITTPLGSATSKLLQACKGGKPLRSSSTPRWKKQQRHEEMKLLLSNATAIMGYGTWNSRDSDKIHTDVLAEARNSCYKARDSFYSCLEKESSKKPTEVASVGLLYPSECKKSREQFVKLCRPTWVKHFDRQYCAKKRVQRLLDDDESRKGPISLPQPYTFKP